MNKTLKVLCTSIMATIMLSSVLIVNAATNSDEVNVKGIINQYFTNELKTMSTFKTVDSSTLIDNENLKQHSKLSNNLKAQWYKSIDEKLVDYKLYLDYNSIKFDGYICKIDLIKGTDLIFDKSSEITQKTRGENHSVILKKNNNKWSIEQDYFEENGVNTGSLKQISSRSYDEKLKEEIIVLEDKIKNVKLEADKFKKGNEDFVNTSKLQTLITPQLVAGYNGSAAVNYAYKYYQNYNTAAYTTWGSDCTNFVSQCIKSGGVPTDGTWFKDSNAWIRVIELRNWLVSKGYAKELTWSENCKEGDLIQLYHKDYGWYHSLIITYRNPSSGQLFISSHTGDHYNYALFNYYPTAIWINIRYLKLTS